MENLLEYIVKSSGLIAAFYLTYILLLRKETFFRSNRWFLLFGFVTSVLLPLVTFKKIVWVEPTPIIEEWKATSQTIMAQPENFEINWLLVFSCIYSIGLLLFLFQLLFDFKHLWILLKGKNIKQVEDYKLIDVNEKVAPFSYFNYIVYNSKLFNESELKHILAHERVHCEQKHSIDVLISRIFCIVFWYNPIIWFYKKAMMQNLEFIADTEALKTLEDKKSYQITLLKVTTQHNCVAITNPFYQSLIKKRIVMLNKNQSKKSNYWKYFIIIPALAAFLFYFQVKVIAQERQRANSKEQVIEQETVAVEINKNSTNEQLKNDAALLKKEHNIKLKFSKVKRNAAGEIVAIKVEYNDAKGSKGVSQYSGDEPIKPIRFYKSDDGTIGFATASDESERYVYKFRNDDDEDNEVSVTVFDDEDNDDAAEAPEAAEAAEAAETPEAQEATEAPEPPLPPKSRKGDKKVMIKKLGNGKNKIQIVVNDEVIDLDSDRLIAELEPILNRSLSSLDQLRFDLDTKEIGKIRKKALREARISIEKAKPELERARVEMERIRPEMLRTRREVESSKPELEAAKKEMEAAKVELMQARIEIEKSKAELDKLRAEQKKEKK